MRKSPREILNVKDEERHAWLLSTNINELSEFLTLVNLDNRWSAHGRDALNILLAKENIKLQTDIKDMTAKLQKMTNWVVGLTIVITFLTFVQAYQGFKIIYSDIHTFLNPSKIERTTKQPDRTDNQTNTTNKAQNSNNKNLNRTKILNHKETPNKQIHWMAKRHQ